MGGKEEDAPIPDADDPDQTTLRAVS